MSWKQQGIAAKEAIARSEKALMPQYGSSIGRYNYIPPGKFMQVLYSNFMSGEIAPDPLRVRSLYPIMLWAIPQLAATLDMHARIIGIPMVDSKDAAFVNDYEQWAKEFIWKGEVDFPYDKTFGIASYTYTLAINTMAVGQSFATTMDTQGNQIKRASQPIGFIRLHDSSRFDFQQYNVDRYLMTYEHGGTQEYDVPETPQTRQPIRFRTDPRFPIWGVPVLYGTERDCTTALMNGEAARAHNSRVANPSSILVASFNPNMAGSADDIASIQVAKKEWDSKMVVMRDAYAARQAEQNRTGAPWAAFEFAAGGEVVFNEHIMGKDIKPTFSAKEEVLPSIAAAVVGAYGVPEFVGIQTVTGTGIGSDQYTQMTARMEGFGMGCRKVLEPHLIWLLSNSFLRTSKRIPKFDWAWDGLTVSNEKGEAEIAKIWSEHEKNSAETAQIIAEGAGVAAVNAWLKANDSAYEYPATLPLPPNPAPAR